MKKDYTYSFWMVCLIAIFTIFCSQSSVAQYCTLTCIEDIRVSVGLDCEAAVNYRMVLQDPDNPFTCSPNGPAAYKLVVMEMDSIPIASSPIISCDYIGQTLTVKAQHWLTGNSCWSTIKVEDKLAPQLDCGEPVTIWCNENIAPESEGGAIPLPAVTNKCADKCESLTYTYEDKIVTAECGDDLSNEGDVAKIERVWTVCDGFNNCGTCTQNIIVKNLIFSEIEVPEISTVSCSDNCNTNDIACVGGPSIHGQPISVGFCNVSISSADVVVDGCEGTSTITRTWTITNPCTEESINRVQTIHIVDNTGPTIICSSTPIEPIVNPFPSSCLATINVPPATITDDCSSAKNIAITTYVYHLLADGSREVLTKKENTNGGFSQSVPLGRIGIVYEATDDCGNTSTNIEKPCVVDIRDDLAPTPICNGSTKLSVNNNGNTTIYASSFANGSYDNCCIDRFEARRMDQPTVGFTDFVDFNCEDVGKTIMVAVRVYDCAGNFADCMVEAATDDKAAPTVTYCPPPVPIDCNDGITVDKIGEDILGTPIVEESCSSDQVTRTLSIRNDYRNECGLGAVIYLWTFTDAAGNRSTCQQVVSFYDGTPFTVEFPKDFKPEQCYGLADLVPSLTGSPQVSGTDCEKVEMDYIDVVTSEGDICRKVERTWTVRNVCATQASQLDSVFTHVQILEIKDTEAPIVNCGTSVSVCIDNNACSVAVDVAGISVQDCGSELTAAVDWVFTPNENCSGEVITGKVSNGIAGFTSPKFGPGTLMVAFNVSDNCGNISSCSREYVIKDCKAPSVSCQSGIVLPLEEDGKAVFWAKDFDEKSFDNCSTCFNGNLLFSFSKTVGDSSKVYTCADLGEQPVVIYVTDHVGNQTFCETNIIIQSPNGVCDDSPSGGDNSDGGNNGGDNGGDPPVGGDNSGGGNNGGDNGGDTGIDLGINCGTTETVCITGEACTASVNVVGVDVKNFCGDKIEATADWQFIPNAACKLQPMEGRYAGVLNGFTSPAFGPGKLTISFEIVDGCGNTAICIREYEIVDCEPPTARCLNGLTLGLGEDGTVEFWAKDFNQNTTDNCADCGSGEVFFSFSESQADTGFVFTCDHIGTQSIELFMWDAAENRTSCVVNFTVTGVPKCGQSRTTTVGGNIVTVKGEEVPFVNIILEDMDSGASNIVATEANGNFAFDAPIAKDYMLRPERIDNIDNGVTTFDLILLQRHIIGLDKLTDPYQLIAADVNNSGSITALDMVELRRAILKLNDEFTNNTSWRFVASDFVFENPSNPTAELMPQEVYISGLEEEQSFDFIAIKIGDINGSVRVNQLQSSEPRSKESLVLTVEDVQVQKGETYDITFTANRTDIQGAQFTLKHAPNDLLYLGTKENDWISSDNIGQRFQNNGLLTFSWNKKENSTKPLEYTLSLQAQKDGMLSQLLDLSSTLTPIEAYTPTGQILDVQLNFQRTSLPFELLQNTPNPFAQNTVIPFTLPKKDIVKIMVVNTAGKILWEVEKEFEKGYNEVAINDIHTSGVLYYRIKTGSKIATKKMIRLE